MLTPPACCCRPPCLQVLALELLKILLENSGPQFQTTERFVSAIKQYLCLSLLKNCQGAVPAALRLCCSIFLTLMAKFRKNLKAEIGVFFPMILLRPIEPAVSGATPNAAGGQAEVAQERGRVSLFCFANFPLQVAHPPLPQFGLPCAPQCLPATTSCQAHTASQLPPSYYCRCTRRGSCRTCGHCAQGCCAALHPGHVRGWSAAGGCVC